MCVCGHPQAIKNYSCDMKSNNQSNKSYCLSLSSYGTQSTRGHVLISWPGRQLDVIGRQNMILRDTYAQVEDKLVDCITLLTQLLTYMQSANTLQVIFKSAN